MEERRRNLASVRSRFNPRAPLLKNVSSYGSGENVKSHKMLAAGQAIVYHDGIKPVRCRVDITQRRLPIFCESLRASNSTGKPDVGTISKNSCGERYSLTNTLEVCPVCQGRALLLEKSPPTPLAKSSKNAIFHIFSLLT